MVIWVSASFPLRQCRGKKYMIHVWSEFIEAGFKVGMLVGKALRAIKSCVGTTWCRYVVDDSVGRKESAFPLVERYSCEYGSLTDIPPS
ncbi:uncharacterized protein EI90DRAFT_3068027 [Cantharellus anzutake]|uniref:uncharacterized protein n=1 Tax=Cantharellus anzutake TaxID=1750568 RepID=UPI00190788D4|nr:uncharacterized protein EI90DRAFT_3068027 [Cantharellus anzutake]KAF8327139.1 hypothetical protein EI90DRAFT_3068027 [Cantharellus anzutake]